MATNYPTSLDSYSTKNAGDTIAEGHINDPQDAIEAIEAKIGTGADTPVSGDVMKGTGTGTSGWAALTTTDLPAGSVVQVVNYQRQDEVACATVIPMDNNARTSAEGNQILTVTITPKSNSNKLFIQVAVHFGGGSNNCIILMDGTTVLATGRCVTNTHGDPLLLNYWMTSPGTTAKTFNVNAGANGGGGTLNKTSISVDAGKLVSSITITEIKG